MLPALAIERDLNLGKSGQLALEPESRPAVNAERNKSGRGLFWGIPAPEKSLNYVGKI